MKKEWIIEYINEFILYHSDINGIGGLDKILDRYTFEEVLKRNVNMANKDYAKSQNRCPGMTFLLIRESDNKIVENASLRWNLTPYMIDFGGHIGYSIRLTERRKG